MLLHELLYFVLKAYIIIAYLHIQEWFGKQFCCEKNVNRSEYSCLLVIYANKCVLPNSSAPLCQHCHFRILILNLDSIIYFFFCIILYK